MDAFLGSYLLLASVYFGLLAGKSRAGKSVESVSAVFRRRGLRYLALALVDVEATYLTQRAMQYTTLVSIQVRLLLMSQILFGKIVCGTHTLSDAMSRNLFLKMAKPKILQVDSPPSPSAPLPTP